jgi:hypothetical protein
MSVQLNHYVMWGLLGSYAEFEDMHDRFEPYFDSAYADIHHHSDGLCVLYDGMDGKYIAIGHVLHKTANHDGFDKPIKLRGADIDFADIQRSIEELIGRPIRDDEYCSLLMISHYR